MVPTNTLLSFTMHLFDVDANAFVYWCTKGKVYKIDACVRFKQTCMHRPSKLLRVYNLGNPFHK